jgi:hypothetical protein
MRFILKFSGIGFRQFFASGFSLLASGMKQGKDRSQTPKASGQ